MPNKLADLLKKCSAVTQHNKLVWTSLFIGKQFLNLDISDQGTFWTTKWLSVILGTKYLLLF